MEIFTEQEVMVLRSASRILQAKQEFNFRKSLDLPGNNDFISYGQLRYACEVADDALFDCFNLASAHFGCLASGRGTGGWHTSETD